jgi:hypothetical protein
LSGLYAPEELPAVEEAEVARRQPKAKLANGHPPEALPGPESHPEAEEPGDAWEPDLAALDAELVRTGYFWENCRKVLRREVGKSPMRMPELAKPDFDLLMSRLAARPDKAPLEPGNGGNGNGG